MDLATLTNEILKSLIALDPTGILGKSSLKASRYRFVVDDEEVVLVAAEGREASDTDPYS
jgi:hypothetical protein